MEGMVDSASILLSDRGLTVAGAMEIYGFAGDGIVSVADGNSISTLLGTFNIVQGDLDYNVSLDLSFFQGLIDSSAQWAGLVIKNTVENGFGPGADICSKEGVAGTSNTASSICLGASAPTLTLDIRADVPEPSTLALLGAGLLGLFMRRKRVA